MPTGSPSDFSEDIFTISTGPSGRQQIKATSLADIFSEPEEVHRWIVDGLLISGGCSLLGSKPKTGKTTFTRDLARSVATGQVFLGRQTVQRPVLIFSFEEKMYEIRRHFKDMGCTGLEPIFIVSAPVGRNPAKIIGQLADQIKPGLVIVDTLVHALGATSDLNDYLDVSRGIEPLVRLARESDLHLMLVHHLGKQERSGGDGILGSTAIFGMMDSVFLMDRSEKHRTMRSIVRYGEDLPTSVITMDATTRRLSLFGTVEDANDRSMELEIQSYLSSGSTTATEAEIDASVTGRTATKRRALRSAVEAGMILRIGAGTKSDPYRYSCSPP